MAKKVVASLKDKSGVKYSKLIRSVKSEKTGAYIYKEEITVPKISFLFFMKDHLGFLMTLLKKCLTKISRKKGKLLKLQRMVG